LKSVFWPSGSIAATFALSFNFTGDMSIGLAVGPGAWSIAMNKSLALIAAITTLALATLPASAVERNGRDAYGALTTSDPMPTARKPKPQGSDRETAIRECNAARSGYSQTAWGVRSDAIYRSCMAGRGQPE
jgi:hypothetical protein